jgi:TolB-like protein
MNTKNLFSDREIFTDELVLKQAEKILLHPPFANSDILRKFLKYIINETLFGKPDQIKEYTIAVYVLNKPANFRPLNDGIVRVHARRLRDALSTYYDEQREDDICEISIPKGSYIPVFRSLSPVYSKPDVLVNNQYASEPEEKMRIAIMPFKSFAETNERLAFTDNIGQLLSAEFIHFTNFDVLSYYTTRHIETETRSIKSIGSEYGVQYLLYGNVHFDPSRIRIVIQLVDAGTEILIWSEKYTHEFIAANLFDMEDIIVGQIMTALKELNDRFGSKLFKKLPVTVYKSDIKEDIISMNGNRKVKKIASF